MKQFADLANQHGIKATTRTLSVYKGRGQLPTPAVYIGDTAGWTKEQIMNWITEQEATGK